MAIVTLHLSPVRAAFLRDILADAARNDVSEWTRAGMQSLIADLDAAQAVPDPCQCWGDVHRKGCPVLTRQAEAARIVAAVDSLPPL